MVYRDKNGLPYLLVDIPECTSRLEYFKYFFCCAFPDVAHTAVIHQEQEVQREVKRNHEQHAKSPKSKPVQEPRETDNASLSSRRQSRKERSGTTRHPHSGRPSNAATENRNHGKAYDRNVRYGSKWRYVTDMIRDSRPLNEEERNHKEYLKRFYGNRQVTIYQDTKGHMNEHYPEYETRFNGLPSERPDRYNDNSAYVQYGCDPLQGGR